MGLVDNFGSRDAAGYGAPLVRTTRRIVEDGRLVAAEGITMYAAEADRLGISDDDLEEVAAEDAYPRLQSMTGRPIGRGQVRTAKVDAPSEPTGIGMSDSESPEPDYPRHVGGGYYELSNGERVQGKAAAEEAQAEIDGG